jgi:hypothetical protein
MADRTKRPGGTQELALRRLSFRKVAQIGEKIKGGGSLGWEYSGPREGAPYEVHLEGGVLFRTSPVREIERTRMGVIIRTENSLYEVRYLDREGRDREAAT